MTDRLSALDVSFLYMEEPTTPMHVGGLLVFEPPPEGFDYDRLVALIEDRISLVPRYRQKIKWVPGHLAYPVWVDDADFDITFHVRRSALPRPGSDSQLRELVSRLMSRRLDRNRPLWEMYLVEGLEGGRIAIISKTHHAMVDGVSAVDIGQVILDVTPTPRDVPDDLWMPAPPPGLIGLVADAVAELVRRPTGVADSVRMSLLDLRNTVGKVAGAVGGLAAAARVAARPAPSTPMNVPIGEQRRFGVARTDLDDYKRVRKLHGGTVNDVVLATVAGALRGWLLSRGEAVTPSTSMRALVPVSVRTDAAHGGAGNQISSYLVDLPVGEPDPVIRLSQVSYAMKAHKESGQSVGADALVALGGFAPPTLHSLGARAANGFTRRLFNLVVTNVPGPQFPLYAAGAQLMELFPVVPLARGQGLSIGLTSYNGKVYYGLNADRDALPDVDVIGALIEESLAELVDTVRERDTGNGVRRGLVLGGGGVLGLTWMIAALSALQDEEGFDARSVEVCLGTSGGSVLAALLGCGAGVDVALRHQQGIPAPADPDISWDYDRDSGGAVPPRPGLGVGSPRLLLEAARHPRRVRPMAAVSAAMPRGRGTLQPLHRMIEVVSAPLGAEAWPSSPSTWIVAMDYDAGARVAFGRPGTPPASLADAVVASCAIPGWYAPVTIGGRPYIDGGTLSPTSLDLLAGAGLDEVYVLAPAISFAYDRPRAAMARAERRWRRMATRRVLGEAEALRRSGTAVTLLGPGPEDLAAIGANLMDPRRRQAVLTTSLRTSAAALRGGDGSGPAMQTGAVS